MALSAVICILSGFLVSAGNVLGEIDHLKQFYSTLSMPQSTNVSLSDCTWKTLNDDEECSNSGIDFFYYSWQNNGVKINIDPTLKNSLQETDWDPHKPNIIYIHGYGSGDGVFPNSILRDAYLKTGSYNVFVVDWSEFAKIPCYEAAIHNLKPLAICTAKFFKNLRLQGISSDQITCVGHCLGAHGCGLVSKFINFRMHRIIGLDPTGPMIPVSLRLRAGMAKNVQVIHSNAGTFGDSSSSGTINFCINGGKIQPHCYNSSMGSDLCSHIMSLCYMAESLDSSTARKAQPCARQCPFGPRTGLRGSRPVLIGQNTPDKATGSYCLQTKELPYCSETNENGHSWCCLPKN